MIIAGISIFLLIYVLSYRNLKSFHWTSKIVIILVLVITLIVAQGFLVSYLLSHNENLETKQRSSCIWNNFYGATYDCFFYNN